MNSKPILLSEYVSKKVWPVNDSPAKIKMVTLASIYIMEFRDSPIAGIDVRLDENLERRHKTQIIAQLII